MSNPICEACKHAPSYDECIYRNNCLEHSGFEPKEEDPESLSNQMKLFRMDYSNDNAHFNDEIGIIKRRLDNIEKISREILKRVSL